MKSVRLLAFALMLALGILALSTPAQASTKDKNKDVLFEACAPGVIASSPNALGRNELFGIDAISANDAWAVGNYYSPTNGSLLTLIEHFDGTQWTVVPSPNEPDISNTLTAVAAVSASDVWAVGYLGTATRMGALALHWDGTAWSIIPTPTLPPEVAAPGLDGVAAISTDDVWAVGSDSRRHALTMHWDGTEWSLVSIPTDPAAPLLAVTAVSTDDVWAVGGSTTGFSGTYLILHWDGSTWSEVSTTDSGLLTEVEAVSADDVWAVGHNAVNDTLTMHWDGAAWSVVSSPNISGLDNLLQGVSAVSADDVWAVGFSTSSSFGEYSNFMPLIEHWNGTEWSIVDNSAATSGKLYAVDALSPSNAFAAGAQFNPVTLIERWDGTQWNVTPSQNPGLADNTLLSVDALSPTDVWAVGYYHTYGPAAIRQNTLIQHWDGYNWNIVPSPNGAINENILSSVDAISANDVWAVGMTGDGGDFSSLTMHWDGTEWSIIPSPNPSTRPKYLQSVSAVAPDDVWAVGFILADVATPSQTFIIHWNGTAWSEVGSPNVGTYDNQLYGVTAISANDVWAVGEYSEGNFIDRHRHSLLLHWDGSMWTQVEGPTIANALLMAVSAVSSNDVWAVGTDYSATSSRTLTMHWDGSAWTQVPSVDFGTANHQLRGVSALASDDVWAAGFFEGGTLIEHWDGTQWSIIYITTPGLLDNILFDISALSTNDVWAVGRRSDGAPLQTLIEHIGRFSDVAPDDYFYTPVTYLVEQGAISGYDDCTFRPGNNTTRGQLSKIVSLAQGWTLLDPLNPTFADVPRGSTFYQYVETMFSHGVISGYPCGGPTEPCDEENRPYFRPNAEVTRAQVTKIVVLSMGWALQDPKVATFADVKRGSTFYTYIETAVAHGVINGYECGAPSEPCDGQNHGYFRPNNSATRGQIAKIVYRAVTTP